MASAASAHLLAVVVAPNGKPTTVQTLTAEPRSSRATRGTQYGLTQTEAKTYLRASAQILRTSSSVASGRRMV